MLWILGSTLVLFLEQCEKVIGHGVENTVYATSIVVQPALNVQISNHFNSKVINGFSAFIKKCPKHLNFSFKTKILKFK